ncbi:hypothetical protein Apa02nite_096430 [Actinoplanes palleronii]|uniref:Uncharacterized protein n=1 Tax=Actinoplanes palleronii TaxID=113570 RepID=A0ABQ4BS76_9ACTN|nr:hypothetical protein Apa02nite_096430 [Actinoplanes palleronii]
MDPRDPSAALSRANFQRMVDAPPKRFYARLLRPEEEVRLRVVDTYRPAPRHRSGYLVDVDV